MLCRIQGGKRQLTLYAPLTCKLAAVVQSATDPLREPARHLLFSARCCSSPWCTWARPPPLLAFPQRRSSCPRPPPPSMPCRRRPSTPQTRCPPQLTARTLHPQIPRRWTSRRTPSILARSASWRRPAVLPRPLPPPPHLHDLLGLPPRRAGLGTGEATHGRHGHDDAFHYHPEAAVVVDSLVLQQHGRGREHVDGKLLVVPPSLVT